MNRFGNMPGRAAGALVTALFTLLGGEVVAGAQTNSVVAGQPTFTGVEAIARSLAAQQYKPSPQVPAMLKELTYDQLRDIRYRPDYALWKDSALFTVQFFHLGFLYERPVQINVVRDGIPSMVPYGRELFDYGKNRFKKPLPPTLGFAGFRVHYPLHTPTYNDEVIAFLGASYFRFLGREQQYGMSARGLAIDTALPKGEEFPVFREFWLEQPAPNATELTLFALLDSPSVTGAYKFLLKPGTVTTVDVSAHLFARRDIQKLGIAPLTSMMLYAENRTRDFDDFRPEVHDTDSLLVEMKSGEQVLRPLTNPRDLQVTAFLAESPRGFGLLQRDRAPSSYGDLEANYHRRPSYWVEPLEDWGPGHVELVEIPSSKEIDDNIVAFWVGDKPLKKGEELTVNYRLNALLDEPILSRIGRVESTRLGSARQAGAEPKGSDDARRIVIDFGGKELALLRPSQPVEAVVSSSRGAVSEVTVQKDEQSGSWHVSFRFEPDGDAPTDLRCFLRLRGQTLTETWTHLWSPS